MIAAESLWALPLVGIAAAISPVLVVWITGLERRREKAAEHARQDALAARTAAVAEVARKKAEDASRASAAAALVVSQTLAKQTELAALVRECHMIRELVDLRRAAGTADPNGHADELIATTEAKIGTLRDELSEMARVADKAAASAAAAVAAAAAAAAAAAVTH